MDESDIDGASPTPAAAAAPLGTTSLWLLFTLTALMSIGYGLVFTLLADIRDRYGFTDGAVGLIAFAGFASGCTSQIALSRFADRGFTSLMVRVGIAVAASSMFWMLFATDLWQWVGARVLFGLGTGMVGPATRRVIIARDEARIGANLGRQTAFDVGGFVIGPLLAAVLAQWFDLRTPFLVMGLTYVIALLLVGRLDLRSGVQDRVHRSMRTMLARPAMQSALASAIAFYLTIGTFEALWAILLRDLGAQTWLTGITLSVFTLPMIFFAPRGGALAQRRGPIRILTISILVAAACTFTYGFGPLWLLVLVSGIHATADSFTMPGTQVAVALSSPSDQLAAGQGLLGATGLAVAGVAALAGSAMYDAHGRAFVFSGVAALMVVLVLIARGRWTVAQRTATELDAVGG